MKKGEIITIKFNVNDRLKANRRASRLIDIESGVSTPKSKIHKSEKQYNRKNQKINIEDE